MVGYISIVECALAVIMFIGYFVFKITSGDFFGEFTYEFSGYFMFVNIVYGYMMIERMLLGAALVLLYNIPYCLVLPIVTSAGFIIFCLVKRPYK